MKKIIIDGSTSDQRLDKFLKRYLPNAGTGFLYKMLREKKIKLNGVKSDGKSILRAGDEITVYFSDETLEKFMGEDKLTVNDKVTAGDIRKFSEHIIYEDRDVLILNKPAGMLSQKSRPEDVSACELLVAYLTGMGKTAIKSLNEYRPSAVNRLDRNTSGILVCAKTLPAARELSKMFRDRSLKKEYLALVHGRSEERADIRAYLKKDSTDNKVTVSAAPGEGFERIETAYEPVGYIENSTLLNVELITGKTHQIRAHLSYTGHPIVGDPKYGNKKTNSLMREKYGLKRQFLHAYRLTFPILEGCLKELSGRVIEAELPKDLKAVERDIKYEYR